MMELLQIFKNFKLHDLNDKWVNTVWDSQFLTYEEPPQDDYFNFIKSEDMDLLLQNTCEVVKDCLAEIDTSKECNNEEGKISWDALVSLNINVHALLSVLHYIIKSGQHDKASKTSKQTCLNATSLYFMLLAIPGSHAFNIFHPNLYEKAIESLKLCKLLIPTNKKGNKTVHLECMDISEDESNDHVYSPSEKILLIEGLESILSDFIAMIKLFSFRTYSDSLDITIFILLEVIDINQFEYQNTRNNLFCNAYTALYELCDNKHGPINSTIMIIVKYIHPYFLFNKHNDHQTKLISNMHELTIDLLRKLLDTYEKETKIALMTLIQYIMVKCPERQEARQKQVTLLLKLLTICKGDIMVYIINDVISLSHHTKVSCRVFAQEIIGKLLLESNLSNYNLIESFQQKKIIKTLIATTLSRCIDSSNIVRSKAMAIIAEFTDKQNNITDMIVENTSKVSCSDETLPLFDELKNMLVKDVNPIALNVVFVMLIDRVEDERALVRKSALQIFKNLTIKFPILTCQVTPIIGRRCRDPVMTVRRFAIHTLSVILQYFPSDSQILNEWIETVLPQIFDTEIKVQEKALESFQDLLINKITNHSNYIDNALNSLPWRIVDKLIDMKMIKHLSKACEIWIKNNLINNSLIKDIQSHIGSTNDRSAWVLLTAISESMKLPNLNKYIGNCKDLIEKNNYHTNLILQILKNSWSSLSKDDMKDLYNYLYKCLREFKIHFGLIGICLDIIGGIIKKLHPDDNNQLVQSNMMELMEISELRIQNIFENDNKTVIDISHFIKAMSTLGHTAFSCTNKLSSFTLRILEGILLESETLPDSIKEVKELHAFAVVVLGQHAIRDYKIAQEVIPILGRLLRTNINHNSSTEVAIKVNAAKALADLCIRFTTLVEPYLTDMCICMKDRNPIVREAIVIIFIQLLLEDFIKVKGPFFFHILTMLFDPDKMIRELTIFLIEERLLKKNKLLISQKFLESIFHYNNYQFKHELYKRKMRKEEKEILTFPGNKNHSNRTIIYNFMIDHLDPPEKIKLLVKLTTQILGRICNGAINVTKQEGACVLKDTLYILNNESLQLFLSSNKNTINSQDPDDSINPLDILTANAITVIIEGMKRHGLEVLLPTLLKVKEKLEILKSPLKQDLMRFVCRMCTIYNKEQLTNLLNEYPQLEEEIDQYKKSVDKDVNMETDNIEIHENLASHKNGTENLETNIQLSICNRIPKVILHRISPASLKRSQESKPSTSTPKLSDRRSNHKRSCILPIKKSTKKSHSQEMVLNHKVIKNNTEQIESDNDSE